MVWPIASYPHCHTLLDEFSQCFHCDPTIGGGLCLAMQTVEHCGSEYTIPALWVIVGKTS